jgi:DHA1 family bicyclomycin/chloramphenicol resistance-like MFS transporter
MNSAIKTQSNQSGAQPYLTLVAALLSMIAPFSIDTYLPSFPAIESDFGVSRTLLTQSLGAYLIGFAVSTLFWGPLADRFGRRLIIFTSLVLYILASIACALSESLQSFLIIRLLQGVAASGGLIAGRAMIRDAHDAKSAHRAMSHVTMLFAIAPAIAPIIGGWLQDSFGWRSVFWFLSSFGLVLITLACFIKETLAQENQKSLHPINVLKVYRGILSNRRFLGIALTLSSSFAGMFLYIAGAPTVIYEFLGLNSNDFTVIFIPMVSGMALGAYISSRLAHRWKINRIINFGFCIMGIAVIVNLTHAMVLESSIFTVITPIVIYSFGMAIAMPALTILALDCFPHHRGTATSTQSFLQMSANAIVASAVVPLLHTQWIHFALGQTVFLVCALLLWVSSRNIKNIDDRENKQVESEYPPRRTV